MIIKIVPYKIGSRSARDLANALTELGHNVKRVKPDSETYRYRDNHIVINWGNSRPIRWLPNEHAPINSTFSVQVAANKLTAMEAMHPYVPLPTYTPNQQVAQAWLDNRETEFVVERHTLNGHSGAGMAIKSFGEDISPAPLYTKYVKKAQEFRVHVFNEEVIDVQEKRRRRETPDEEVNYQVRNHQNGWVFCRDGIEEPQGIRELAIAAINAIGLDFGAVDIIYNRHFNQLYVLEVNTACGLEGTTLQSYANAIDRYVSNA